MSQSEADRIAARIASQSPANALAVELLTLAREYLALRALPSVPYALPGHRHELVKMGSTIPCARCGGRCVEFMVPNDVWNAVVRLGGKERDDEYMCEACYRRAVEQFVAGHIRPGQQQPSGANR